MAATRPEETNEVFAAAINRGDVEAALAMYEPNACLVGTPGETAVGTDAIRAVLQNLVDAGPTLTVVPGSVLQVDELAVTVHAWTATADGPDGPLELGGHAVEVMRRQPDGTWRFVIDDPYGGAPPAV